MHKVHLDEVKKGDVIVTNIRHYQNLMKARLALDEVIQGIDKGITNDFLALELRNALYMLSEIDGQKIEVRICLKTSSASFVSESRKAIGINLDLKHHNYWASTGPK